MQNLYKEVNQYNEEQAIDKAMNKGKNLQEMEGEASSKLRIEKLKRMKKIVGMLRVFDPDIDKMMVWNYDGSNTDNQEESDSINFALLERSDVDTHKERLIKLIDSITKEQLIQYEHEEFECEDITFKRFNQRAHAIP